MKKIWVFVIFAGVVILIFLASGRLTYKVSPVEFTHTSMGETSNRIELYRKANGKLPDNLAQLPKREGYINSIVDGWGKNLKYVVKDAQNVVLVSYGEDGQEGGVNSAADIVQEFKIK